MEPITDFEENMKMLEYYLYLVNYVAENHHPSSFAHLMEAYMLSVESYALRAAHDYEIYYRTD